MSKIFFSNPIIYRGGMDPDPTDPITVGGSAGGGINPLNPVNYTTWVRQAGTDLNHDGNKDEYDYVIWWTNMMNAGYSDFTQVVFDELNPNWTGPSIGN